MTTPFLPPQRLLARQISPRFTEALRSDGSAQIDLAAARAQHEGYVETLRALGFMVEVLGTDEACPDACFLEDTAVITGAHAVVTVPGAPSRRPEVEGVAAALERDFTLHRMALPATLDGGDVLRVGGRLFVGLSSRTNRAGLAFLASVAALDGLEVVAMEVRGGLHLKSACTLADGSRLLYDPALLGDADLVPLRAAGVECLAVTEPAGANVLALGGAVLVSAAAPRTAAMLRSLGLDVRMVTVGEMHKADGALTCLSLRLPPKGGWST